MEPISIVTFIGLILSLLTGIMREFFSYRARVRQRNEKFEITKKIFLEFIDKTLASLREEARRENGRIGDVEDEIDRDIKR